MAAQQTIKFRASITRTPIIVNMTVGREGIVGSSDRNEIIVNGQDILPQHARLSLSCEGFTIQPIDQARISVNGAPIGDSALLADGDWLSLGSCNFQVHFSLPPEFTENASQSCGLSQATKNLSIGRLPDCDVVLASPLISRQHARLYCNPEQVELEDLNSTNGTFVNGRRLTGRLRLKPADRISFASFSFLFTGQALEGIDTSGRIRVEARGLYKEVVDRSGRQKRRLLDDISLVIEPGEFVVIFGTSGSGKSTLMDALNGRRPMSGGELLYNGTRLYDSFDTFRAVIGYVPQQDIVHRKISVKRALEYTAELRLPPDTSKQEIDSYIGKVLEKVELAEKSQLPIDTPAPLSGGQLKRVSLAVELVANPNILFLDEVTSGLDAGTDKRMMRLFADLAADQKTIVCVTHTLENIDACHLVLLLHQGKLVFFGPPQESLGYFNIARLSDVYDLLESRPADFWQNKFRGSTLYQKYIVDRMDCTSFTNHGMNPPTTSEPVKKWGTWFEFRQSKTLLRRYIDLILSDRKNLLILLLQAPVIALVIGLVFDPEGSPAQRATAENQIFFILVLSAIWFGTLNSARELVKELPIYLRERSVNLGILPYLFSKLVPLAVLCLIQCLLLLGIVSLAIDLPGSYALRNAALFVAGLAATGMGLAVSAFVDSNEKAIALAPILLIPQVVLSNAVVRLADASLLVAKSSMISLWALDGMKSTLSSESQAALELAGQPVLNLYALDIAMVGVLGCAFLFLSIIGLKLKDRRI